jgi:rRNA biogenesis protein RRP5
MTVGMKILGQVTSVQPLALVISLPDQLLGHVPITEISTQLTALLEATEERGDTSATDDEDDLPDLSELFCVGQYIRAVVTAVHAPGTTGAAETGKRRDDVVKPSRRVELSIVPGKINAGVHKSDLRSGFVSISCSFMAASQVTDLRR